jgi:hypothetical protein
MPFGKITLEADVFICFHFKEGGLPPNSCACSKLETNNRETEKNIFWVMSMRKFNSI